MEEGYKRINTSRLHAIMIMGSTGSGKSTLAAMFSGAQLESFEDQMTYNLVINHKRDSNIQEPKIAWNALSSETKIPNEVIIKVKGIDHYIWDCPGFYDTEGYE